MFNMIPYRAQTFSRTPATRDYLNPFSDDFFRAFFGDDRLDGSFKVDVKDEGDHYLLEADLPGVGKDGKFQLFGADSGYICDMDRKATERAYRLARQLQFEYQVTGGRG